jgi:hypothetical protein
MTTIIALDAFMAGINVDFALYALLLAGASTS